MKRLKNGYTRKQYAYAQKSLAPARTKKADALAVGYSESVANNALARIESTEGYANAISALASDAGNIALKFMTQLKHADISKLDVATTMTQLEKIVGVFERLTVPVKKETESKGVNPLRAIILEHVVAHDAPQSATPHKVIDAETKTTPTSTGEDCEDCEY